MKHKKKYILIILGFCFISASIYIGIGVWDYWEWTEGKEAIAASGMWQCGAYKILGVQPGCVMTSGSCTCPMCNHYCAGSTQIMFAGQQTCGAYTNVCISPEVIPRGGPLMTSQQMIFGSFTGNIITGNGIVATQTLAASRIEKFVKLVDKYIIANFRDD